MWIATIAQLIFYEDNLIPITNQLIRKISKMESAKLSGNIPQTSQQVSNQIDESSQTPQDFTALVAKFKVKFEGYYPSHLVSVMPGFAEVKENDALKAPYYFAMASAILASGEWSSAQMLSLWLSNIEDPTDKLIATDQTNVLMNTLI
jgi:aspartokinase